VHDSDESVIRALADSLHHLAEGSDWYQFGSARSTCTRPESDYDLLIVYRHDDVKRAAALLEEVEHAGFRTVLDVVALSVDEEAATDFVALERARLVWSA
jgi:hypothetical protein